VKRGDLVKHPRCPTLGVGIVTAAAKGTGAIKVYWPSNTGPTAEIKYVLEVISESR